MLCGDTHPGARFGVAPAVRQRHHPGPDRLGDLHRYLELAAGPGDQRDVLHAQPGGVVGMDLQRAAVGAAGQRLQVVHPAVVRAQVTSSDQQEAGLGTERGMQPSNVVEDDVGRQFDCARRSSKHLRNPGLQRPQVDPVRCVLEPLQRQAVGVGAEPVPERSQPQHHVQAPFVTRAVGQHRGELGDVAAGHR